MDSLAATSLMAASAASQSLSAQGSLAVLVGQDPSALTITAFDQASIQTGAATAVLGKVLASESQQVAQLFGAGGVDLMA